jgi:ABC-2 type transport system permease protein
LAFFCSPLAYGVFVSFLLLNGYLFYGIVQNLSDPDSAGGAPMQVFFGGSLLYWLVQLFFCAVLSMRLFAEEWRSGTLDMALSTSTTEGELVLGKYGAALVTYGALWAPTLLYAVLTEALSEAPQDPGPILAGYLGVFAAGSLLLALGLLMSALTRSQSIAAVSTLSLGGVMVSTGLFRNSVLDPSWRNLLEYLDLFGRLGDFGRGLVDTRPLVYCLSGAVFCLFAAARALSLQRSGGFSRLGEKARALFAWRGGWETWLRRVSLLLGMGALTVAIMGEWPGGFVAKSETAPRVSREGAGPAAAPAKATPTSEHPTGASSGEPAPSGPTAPSTPAKAAPTVQTPAEEKQSDPATSQGPPSAPAPPPGEKGTTADTTDNKDGAGGATEGAADKTGNTGSALADAADNEDGANQSAGYAADNEEGASQTPGRAADNEESASQSTGHAADNAGHAGTTTADTTDNKDGANQTPGHIADNEDGASQSAGHAADSAGHASPERGAAHGGAVRAASALLGILFLLFALLGNALWRGLAEAVRGGAQGAPPRRPARAALDLVNLASAVILLLSANYLASLRYLRADWTRAHFFSLSADSLELARALPSPVNAYVFLTPDDATARPLFADLQEVLAQLSSASQGSFSVEYIDPLQNRSRAEALLREYQIPPGQDLNFVLLASPALARAQTLYRDDLADYEPTAPEQAPRIARFHGESALIAALRSLTEPTPRKVYLATGHGEAAPGQDRLRALDQLALLLRDDNADLAPLSLIARAPVPNDANLLVVAGPQTAFTRDEEDALLRYLDEGGRVLLALDPIADRSRNTTADTGLERLAARWGVRLGPGIVFDATPSAHLPADGSVFAQSLLLASQAGEHPITQALGSLRVVFPNARPVELLDVKGRENVPLLFSSGAAWSETNLDPDATPQPDPADPAGPFSLAVASRDENSGGRLVVLGGVSGLLDVFVGDTSQRNPGNYHFARNVLRWLLGQDDLVSLPPKTPERLKLTLDARNASTVFWILLGGLPLLAIAIGAAVWYTRRR